MAGMSEGHDKRHADEWANYEADKIRWAEQYRENAEFMERLKAFFGGELPTSEPPDPTRGLRIVVLAAIVIAMAAAFAALAV